MDSGASSHDLDDRVLLGRLAQLVRASALHAEGHRLCVLCRGEHLFSNMTEVMFEGAGGEP